MFYVDAATLGHTRAFMCSEEEVLASVAVIKTLLIADGLTMKRTTINLSD